MPDATECDLSVIVCEGCGPQGLYVDLVAVARELATRGFDMHVRQASCLSACRFGQVVFVHDHEGLTGYSGRDRNGFVAFEHNPLDELLDRHVPHELTVAQAAH